MTRTAELRSAVDAYFDAVDRGNRYGQLNDARERMDRAIAAAGAAPALDVEAVAREIAGAIPSWYYGADSGMDYMDALRAILRRHALPAAPRAVVPAASTDGIGFPPKAYRLLTDAIAKYGSAVDGAESDEDVEEKRDGVLQAARQCIADGVEQQLYLRARATTTAAPVSSSGVDATPDQSLPVLSHDILAMARFYTDMKHATHTERMAAVDWLRARFLSDHLNAPADGGGR